MGACVTWGSNGIAIFNLALFLARYPEFSQVNPAKLQAYFFEAGLYLSNCPTSPVQNLTKRLILLNMLVAHISILNGDLNATSITPVAPSVILSFMSSAPGPFTLAHGLSVVPNSIEILMTSSGAIWQPSATPPDATNLYLSASGIGVSATINVFQNTQVASSGGQDLPVGRTSSAAEGSVSANFEYMSPEPGNGPWFQQTQPGAAFWEATSYLRSARYIPGPPLRLNGFRRRW
jgi:uncharacterized protein DUF4054